MVCVKGCSGQSVVLLAVALMLVGTGFVGVARAAPDSSSFKIDVGVFLDVNPRDNPINADPGDMQPFQFQVQWVLTRTPLCGLPNSIPPETTGEIGLYTVSQEHSLFVPKVMGQAGEHIVDYCVLPLPLVGYSYPADGFCVGFVCQVRETTRYEITHYQVPKGYCPQYPDGQDRKKEDTETENMKFYRGNACGKVYPGWNGWFDWGPCRPTRCLIMIS